MVLLFMSAASQPEIDLAVAISKIDNLTEKVDRIEEKLEHNYVTQEEFKWVRTVVYGMVSLILVSVFVALLKLVVFG